MEGEQKTESGDSAKLTLDLAKLESDITTKDSEIQTLRTQLASVQGSNQEMTAEQEATAVRVSQLLIDRQKLATDRERLEKEKSEAIKTMSQATQLVESDRDQTSQKLKDLEKQLADYQTKLDQETARNRRSELVQSQFPHLLPFVTDIAIATDEATQLAAIQAFDAKMTGYLQGKNASLVTGALQIPGGAPVVRTEPADVTTQLATGLQSAMDTNDQATFDAAIKAAIEAHNSTVGQA
jgi:DNA repair exonuclease SbcCD ATPase subunit